MRHPAAPLAVAVLAGTAGGFLLPVPRDGLAAAVWLSLAATTAACLQRDVRTFAAWALITSATCGWGLAIVASDAALDPPLRRTLGALGGDVASSGEPSDPILLAGRLREDATLGAEGTRLSIDVHGVLAGGRAVATSGGVLLTVAGTATAQQAAAWRRGRIVRVPALLRRPARYLNPGVPDHEVALLRRGTALVGTVKSGVLVEVERHGAPASEAAAALRAAARATIERAIGCHSPRSSAIVRAILLGDRAGLDDETEERLQAAGTYHVLAISGGNIAILAGVLLLALRAIGARTPIREVAAAVALVAYAWLVGGGASVVRAIAMAVMWLAAFALDHRGHAYNAMATAALAGIAVAPLGLYDPGAWLTYSATFAIVTGARLAAGRLGQYPTLVRVAAGLFVASLAAELAVFPISAFVFSRVTAAGLALNFAAIPLMTVVQVGAMVTLAAGAVWAPASAAAGHVTHLAAWALVESARLVEVLPGLSARLPPPGVGALVGYYGGWVGLLASGSFGVRPLVVRRLRAASGGLVLCAGLWILIAPVPWRTASAGTLRVLVVDVGQGDAILVRCPDGSDLLVDAGGAGGSRFDIGRRVIEPALWAAGVRRLRYLAITHGDADHMSGAGALASDFTPREIWEGVPVPPFAPLADLRRLAAARGLAWRVLQRGDQVMLGGATILAHHPPPPDWERQRVRNDDSIVLEVRYGAVSIVLPGDVEATGEAEWASRLEPAGIRVLLAPHHGSASSSSAALLRAASPALGVISAGRGNRYGHPHRVVLQRFADVGCPILRTDLDGAILLDTDGRVVRVGTFSGRSMTLVVPASVPR